MEQQNTDLAKILTYYGIEFDFNKTTSKIRCMFHNDINASMIVDLYENRWYCFGCNLYGDAFKFFKLIEQQQGITYLSELQWLQSYTKVLRSNKVKAIKRICCQRPARSSLQENLDIAYDYYCGLSKIDWRASEEPERAYMLERGFTEQALNYTKAKLTYNKDYPIIFPMLDNKEFKGYVCRTTDKEIEKKRKYLYNKGFSRATTLVGNYGIKQSKPSTTIILVEGYMDRLKMLQHNHSLSNQVVAILGWKVTQEQIDKIKQVGIKVIVSALDNDECGKKGTIYLKQVFSEQKGFKVIRWKYFKGIKDPGDMTKEQFNKMYNKTLGGLIM